MKKFLSNLAAVALLLSATLTAGACDKAQPFQKPEADTKEYAMQQIAYRQTETEQRTRASQVLLTMPPITQVQTGEEFKISAKLQRVLDDEKPYFYLLADWGDGTWSYNGPFVNSSSRRSNATMKHAYKKAGTYAVKVAAIDLADGDLYGWSQSETMTATGADWDYAGVIRKVQPISSSNAAAAQNIADSDASTVFTCDPAQDSDVSEWAGYLFDGVYRLDRLEIQFDAAFSPFASNIAIEYTTDNGATWYSLPKYYYLYDYSKGRYSPIMRFPNPKGATLSLPLDGINANGIRFATKLFLTEPRQFSISEMRVYGDQKSLFYSSNGGTFDADLNNMWTIFGSAQTEPVVYGSLRGEAPNTSPFRTGTALIGSTEWEEWNGLKFNWTTHDEIKDIYLNTLINTRYGSDGWSNYEGYIWATDSAPQHLDVQNHYSYNSTFIIAARNYLLQGNNTEVYQDGQFVPFLELRNAQGQTMADKIEKAMAYQLTALEGASGILTINDPRNDGTVNGVASNYWDVFKSFGYKSAYENAIFYGSLNAMADIKEYLGDSGEATRYRELAALAKKKFNELFWDNEKGRYIASVNVDGYRADFGMTFVNFYAIAYGAADTDKAQRVYEWLDGKRIVEGDTSRGEDIYGEFKYAARANTLDVSSTGEPYFWWDHNGALPCTPGTFGGFGHTMQNGGTIFYISHYDLMGRIAANGADDAFKRFGVIMKEFHQDSLRRNRYVPYTQGGTQSVGEYCEGVMGEFPESGLVPYTYLRGFLGIHPCAQGLEISANLPAQLTYGGVREYRFANRTYSIQVDKNATAASIKKYGDVYFVVVPADRTFVLSSDNRLTEVNA